MAFASAARADVPAPIESEVQQWSTLLFQYADTGQAGTMAADFRFSTSGSNTVLMAPVRSAVRKLMSAKGVNASNADCTATGVISVADVKSFLVDGKIETSIYDVDKLLAHLNTTAAAQAAGQSVAVSVVDGKYVTVGLDPKTSDLVAITSAPVPLDAALASFMSQLAEVAAGIATGIDHTPKRVTDSLTGTTPYWAEFVMQLLGTNGNQGAPVGANVTTVEAAFGEWGSLVLARVDTGSNYFLVDTVNGAVSGPYDFSQAYDARSLLSTHVEYSTSDPVQYFSATGCATTGATMSAWTALPCPAATPPAVTPPAGSCLPGTPFVLLPPSANNPIPGRPTTWDCVQTGTGATAICTCTTDWHYWVTPSVPPAPPTACPVMSPPMSSKLCVIRVRTTCTSIRGCGGASCNGTRPPNTSPVQTPGTGTPPGMPLPGGCMPLAPAMPCTTTVEYMS